MPKKMVGFFLFCLCFWTGTFAQEKAGNQVVFKTICENQNGVEFDCTVKVNCSSEIDARNKRIEIIDDQALSDCVEVELLALQYNKISEISKNAFRNQQKLQKLGLWDNQIEVLQPEIFHPLTNLEVLFLSKNLIEVIEDSLFSKNEKLEHLFLHENKIFAVGPNAFEQLTKLKYLTLFGNPCMHPNVTWETNTENLGVFFDVVYENRKWEAKNNTCISSYNIIGTVAYCDIKNKYFKKKLIGAEKKAYRCDLNNNTVTRNLEDSFKELSGTKAGTQNCQIELTENQKEKIIIVLITSIIITSLLIIIIAQSVKICKLKSQR